MFDQFSDRAKRVVFLTRLYAGRRGAPALEPNDLVVALVQEDQGELAKPPFPGAAVMSGLKPSRPYFSAEAASEIRLAIERVSAKSKPIPDSEDMQASPALSRTFQNALALREKLGQKQVEPLLLLAGFLSEQPCEACEILKQAGITREAVLAAITTGEHS